MTPKQVTDVDMSRITKKKLPSLTWKIDREEGQVRGTLDEAEAMRQAVEKMPNILKLPKNMSQLKSKQSIEQAA